MRGWLGLLVVSGCASQQAIPALPSQGGPGWFELTSPHFTLWTDTSEGRARELMTEMEHLRQIVIGTSFRSVANEARAFVIALRDDDEYHAYAGDFSGALAMPPKGNGLHQAVIVLPAETATGGEQHREAHELTHVISFGVIHDQPRWFSEGLAQYFETIKLGGNSVDVGAAPSNHNNAGQRTMIRRPASLRTMLACAKLTCADGSFYAAAWALFTYLTNVRAPELERYMQLLAEGHGDRAFGEAFKTPLDDLESEMKEWLVRGSHVVRHYNVQYMPFSVAERALGEGDVLATRAFLESHLKRPPKDRIFAAIDMALAVERTNVIASSLSVFFGREVGPDVAKAIAAAHPEDWRAWWLVGKATADPSARAKACELAALNPAVELRDCTPAIEPSPAPPPPLPPVPPVPPVPPA